MTEDVKAQQSKEGEQISDRENTRATWLPRFSALLANPRSTEDLQEILNQLASYFTSEKVLAQIDILQTQIRTEREAKEKTTLDEIETVLERAGKAVRESKTPADLDAPITDLRNFRQRGFRGQLSERVRLAFDNIEPTLQYVKYWQNYLSAKETDDARGVQDALRSLSNSDGPAVMPRSEILKLMTLGKEPSNLEKTSPIERAEKILNETKTPDDLANTVRQLRKLMDSQDNSSDRNHLNAILQSILPVDKSYQGFKAGLVVSIEVSSGPSMGSGIGHAAISRLKEQLLLLELPRYVGASEDTRAMEGEHSTSFLNRIINEAKDRGDIGVAIKSREALRYLQRVGSNTGIDAAALGSLVSGQNQEAAGQYALAVISYHGALRSGSDLVPAKSIGERLTAIQAAHPKEFEAGMERVLNAPARFDPMQMAQVLNMIVGFNQRPGQQPAQPASPTPPTQVTTPTPAPK